MILVRHGTALLVFVFIVQVAPDELYVLIPRLFGRLSETIIILDAFVAHKNDNASPVIFRIIDREENLVKVKNISPCECNKSAGKFNHLLRADRDRLQNSTEKKGPALTWHLFGPAPHVLVTILARLAVVADAEEQCREE